MSTTGTAPPSGPWADLRAAWSLLTSVGGAAAPSAGAARWYGPVGVALGGALGLSWWGLDQVTTPLLGAVVVVALDAALTGMLHLDGLADSADGLVAPMARARRLEVMRRPDIGSFGVVVVVLALALQIAALAAVRPAPMLLVGLWACARALMAAAAATLPYARAGTGLPSAFAGRTANCHGAIAGGVLGVAALATTGWHGWAALAGAILAAGAVGALARRRIGGYTGDVLGAIAVLSQSVGLVAFTLR